jgi:hypothetical protein
MRAPKPPCETVLRWLQANLGAHCTGSLTGSDVRALKAAVMIVEAYSYDRCHALELAFQLVVLRMQLKTREFAYHAIAHVMDWGDRDLLWARAELPHIETPWLCQFGPARRGK